MGTLSRRGARLCAPALAVWFAMAIAPTPAWSQVGTVQDAVQEGVSLLQQGRIPEAVDRLKQASEEFPSDPLVWLALGQTLEAARRQVDAIPAYLRAATLAPESDAARRANARLDQLGRDRETYEAAQREFRDATQALAARDFSTAETRLQRILTRLPRHVPTLFFLGNIADQTGRDAEAESRWLTAGAIDPTYFPAHVSLGRLYERVGKPVEASAAYRAAVATKAAHPDVQFAARRLTQVGATHEQAVQVFELQKEAGAAVLAGRTDDAQRAFERVLSVLPTNAPAAFALGLIKATHGDTFEATRLLRAAVEGDPDHYLALFLLAQLEAEQGLFEESIEHYQRVMQIVGPRNEGIEARRRLPALEEAREKARTLTAGLKLEARGSFDEGIAAFQKNDYETAFRAFTRAVVLDETNPYYVFNRGLAAFHLRNSLVAAKSFERVIELAPEFGTAHFWLGVMFQASAEQARDARNLPEAQAEYKAVVDRLDKAIQYGDRAWYLDEAQKRRNESANFLGRYQEDLGYITLGGVLGAQNRLNESLEAYGRAAQVFQYDFQPLYNIGAILTDLKVYDDARLALERAAAINPAAAKPHIQLGFLFEEQEKLDEALAAYRKAAELSPESPIPYGSIGAVLMRMERYEEALTALERNVELAGGTSTPLVHWDMAFLSGQFGRATVALHHYRKVRELLEGRTEKEAVDLRRSAEDNIATLEEKLRPYRFSLSASPWRYDTNIASTQDDPIGEVMSSISGSVRYWFVNEETIKLSGSLDHAQTYYLSFRQTMGNSTGLGASVDYTLNPKLDLSGSYRWSYNHGSQGPEALGQSLGASITRRGQLPSGMTFGLSYNTSSGLGRSTTRTASTGYSLSLSQAMGEDGTLQASFSATGNDSNRDDQVNQSKSVSLVYSRALWSVLSASVSYGLSITDYVNPFQQVDANTGLRALVVHNAVGKNYGLNVTHNFRQELDVSVGVNFSTNDSNFAVDQEEDLDELLANLVDALGSYRKLTMSLTVSKTF
ncbi:MAG: tetratricopeptide repeat protein [Nitrospirota bacterium]